MTQTTVQQNAATPARELPGDEAPRRPSVLAIAVIAIALVAAGAYVVSRDGDPEGRQAYVSAQGDGETALWADAARLDLRADGLFAEVDIPTPAPGSYEYPTSDLVPPWAAPHPPINPGASDAPEAFTAWVFIFNDPDQCTDGQCDLDDIGADTAARGGSYILDGRIADGDRLVLSGNLRIGQDPASGARLDNPTTAEVHVAVAPHGRALPGADGWRQLNGPVGNPTYWWAATFTP